MKIGFISDFQRQNSDPAFVQRMVDILNPKDLDAVIIAGDFIDRGAHELPSLEPLGKLETKYGVYGVLGIMITMPILLIAITSILNLQKQ